MKTLMAAAALVAGMGAFVVTTGLASAAVVCNAEGDCWHTDKDYQYKPEFKVEVHPDSWYFHRDWEKDKQMRYREHHDERGYYRSGVWVKF